MFRLIKLAMYALVGYVLYELYQGMTAEPRGGEYGGQRVGGRQGGERRAQATMTSQGAGRREQTLDRDGGSAPHRVGRGVTSS
jgi:hypothetical protein